MTVGVVLQSSTSLAVVGVAVLASFGMAWALGASSNSPPFAPAVGANALPTMRAAFFIGVFAALGAVAQGGSISRTVGQDLIDGVSITPLAAAAALLTAAAFIAIGVRTGYPIPAAFATTGAVVGAGLSLGGAPAFDTYTRLASFWVAVPFVSATIAYGTATLLRRDDVPETVSVPALAGLVGAILANVRLAIFPGPEGQGTLAGFVSRRVGSGPELVAGYDLVSVVVSLAFGAVVFLALRRRMQASVDAGIRGFLVGLGAVVAFSSGGSQVGLATGPIEPLFDSLGTPAVLLLGLGAVGILLGAWMGSPRLLQAVAREYSQLGVRRSIAALIPGFIIAQVAIALGIPISFNNIIISSVIGSGLAAGSAGTSMRKIGFTLVAWLVSLVGAGLVGYGLYQLLAFLTGA
ncbi:inorganic phosphate transporter [Halococcus sp. IIIV-5B]|uniref:inorganic phosphate transporter n=1 Tax=Halococcus sp. IIIV-5B TaxID=2321230 RepID=UPI001F428AF4|nr:inorganic phosphate transporter [Halococcus sp. IIIV-5B]